MRAGWLKYLGLTLLWALVIGLLLGGLHLSRTERQALRIRQIEIEIQDSTSHGQLVTRRMVEGWLKESKMALLEQPASEVDLNRLEQWVARNGFVGQVRASIDLEGVLHINIRQRDPLFRLLTDGYDHYVTADGYLFRAPRSAALYVPVITGSYRPPFPPDFEGRVEDLLLGEREQWEARLLEIETEKYPLYRRERKNIEYHRETRRMFIKQRLLESDLHFEERVEALRAEKRQRRRHYRYESQQIEKGIERVDRKLQSELDRQKKLEKNYQDFKNLTTFVGEIARDPFWRSEMVQIIASKAHSGALEVSFVPRSGAFVVELGELDGVSQRLENVERLFERVLPREGWERYHLINAKYEGRVICQ